MSTIPFTMPAPGTATSSATSASSDPNQGLGALTGTAFLDLLVAQMKNQDPLNPMSSTQFMAQTAQLSTLEQITRLNQETQQVLADQQLTTGLGTIGRTVTGTDASGQSVTGTVVAVDMGAAGPVLQLEGGQQLAVSSLKTVA